MTKKDFFDSMAENWDTCCPHNPAKLDRLLALLELKSGSRVLDVGTGTGVLLPRLLSLIGEEGRITAVDLSEKMLEKARGKVSGKNVDFLCADILTAQLPESAFDCVVCYSAFPHFDDKQRAVNVLSRCLKPGGRLLIAHSQSREAINSLHKDASSAVAADHLPDAPTICAYYQNAGLLPARVVDSGELFAVLGIKNQS